MKDMAVTTELDGDGLGTSDDLAVRHRFADLIHEREIGSVNGSGVGLGVMDISVLVEDPERASGQLRELAAELGVGDRTEIDVID